MLYDNKQVKDCIMTIYCSEIHGQQASPSSSKQPSSPQQTLPLDASAIIRTSQSVNPASLVKRSLNFFPTKLSEANILIDSFRKTPRSDNNLKNTNLNHIWNFILDLNPITKKYIIAEMFNNERTQTLLPRLLDRDQGVYSQERQDILDICKRIDPKVFYSHDDIISVERYEKYLLERKTLMYQRKIPQRGFFTGASSDLLLNSSFSDQDIKQISKVKSEELLQDHLGGFAKKSVSENNKIVLQQQAMKSCGHVCVAMLLMDLGFFPDLLKLKEHLTTDDSRMEVLENYPCKEIRSEIEEETGEEFLKSLQNKILKDGSAIIGIDNGMGGHVIICDEIAEDLSTIRIRDPWHGWEITLHADAFLKANCYNTTSRYCTTVQQIQRL